MNVQEIFEKQVKIMKDVFENKDIKVSRETNAQDIDEWDSLTHISLITEIEKEFKIRFALGELQALKNVGEMTDLIAKKIS